MELLLRIILPVYFSVYFGIAFVAKSIIVAKRIGKNPIVLPKDDSAYGLIGLYFKLIIAFIFVYVFLFAFAPGLYRYFLPIIQFDNLTIKYTGLTLLGLAFILTVIAQGNMKDSWRIGIDTKKETELITTGFFRVSRNPVFLGMMISLVGLFLCTANAITALFATIGYVLIQVQIRLEEEFLIKQHGQKYIDYKQKVRRLI